MSPLPAPRRKLRSPPRRRDGARGRRAAPTVCNGRGGRERPDEGGGGPWGAAARPSQPGKRGAGCRRPLSALRRQPGGALLLAANGAGSGASSPQHSRRQPGRPARGRTDSRYGISEFGIAFTCVSYGYRMDICMTQTLGAHCFWMERAWSIWTTLLCISVPITTLSRRHRTIKKLCSDILNITCSKVISRAFHTGKDRRRVQK
ncbi:uncharacterized protein LOC142604185 [Balearica regulorum gibbericeps]|uniref:uncharacterized protein LOC142604185 n=1 Tax=Balearica regulorum gibbericeps TaxID=100784 RepID=UPI003F5E10C8